MLPRFIEPSLSLISQALLIDAQDVGGQSAQLLLTDAPHLHYAILLHGGQFIAMTGKERLHFIEHLAPQHLRSFLARLLFHAREFLDPPREASGFPSNIWRVIGADSHSHKEQQAED